MKVLDVQVYKDGGTMEIETDKGTYCYDHRIGTSTPSQLYLGMPKDDNSNIIENYESIEKELSAALHEYIHGNKNHFYYGHIERLLIFKDRS